MPLIIGIVTSVLLTLFFFGYMVKSGYFSLIGDAIAAEKSVLSAESGTDEENSGESKEEEDTSGTEYVKDDPEIPAVYEKKRSIVLTVIIFSVSVLVNTLLYSYMMEMADDPQLFTYIKMAVTHTITAAAALTDYKRRKIPNALILSGLIIRVAIYLPEFIFSRDTFFFTLKNDGLGFLIGFVMLFIIAVVSKGGIGFGDVKLFGVIGIMAGSGGVFYTLFLSLLFSSVVSLVLIALKRKSFKSALAMAPFIYTAFAVICILGIF